MESKFVGKVKLNQDEINNGRLLLVEFKEAVLVQDGRDEYDFDLKHKVTLGSLENELNSEDCISKVDVIPQNAEDSDVFMIYELLSSEADEVGLEQESFYDFKKDKIFIAYDFGSEKIIYLMGSSSRETYLNGKITANSGVFKFHIKNGIVKDGDLSFHFDYLDENEQDEAKKILLQFSKCAKFYSRIGYLANVLNFNCKLKKTIKWKT